MKREDLEARQEQERKDQKRFSKIRKSVKKVFIDSDHFYNFNRIFFVMIILFELFQAMIFNSCSDIPTLFMLLVMFAFYAYRKVYTKSFLQYTFFVVYFIHFVLVLKLIFNTLTRIDYARNWMQANQDSRLVRIASITFGSKTDNLSSTDQPTYIFNIFMCFFAC